MNGFVWDDHLIVVPVEAYRSFDLRALLGGPGNSLEYLPVRDLTLALDFALWGERPFGFHLSNIVYYLLGLLLAHRVARRLAARCGDPDPGFIAFWAALVFALHPLHAEPVNFITGRNTILAMGLLLAALDQLLELLDGRLARLPAMLLLFLLALFAKAHAVFFPLFALLLVLLLPGLVRRARLVALIVAPLIVVDGLAIAVHLTIAGDSGLVDSDVWRYGNQSLWVNLAKAAQIPFFYLGKFLWPHPLSVAYPEGFLDGAYPWRAGAAALALAALLAGAYALRRRSPLPLIGLLWFGAALGPVANLVPNSPVVADRYLYPGLFGLALIVAWGLRELAAQRPRVLVAAWAVAGIWVALDVSRSREWRNDRTLFTAAYTAYPDPVRNTYANMLFESGDAEAALALFAGREQEEFRYHYYRGRLREREGDLAGAIAAYRRSLALGGDAERWGQLALARVLERAGDGDGALHHYLQVVDGDGLDPLGRMRGAARAGIARLRAARGGERARLEAAVARTPGRFEAHFALAHLDHRLGDYTAAEQSYLRAAELAPERWEPWYNLGLVRERGGRLVEALAAFDAVLKRKPGDARTLNHMAISAARLGDAERAIGYYRAALAADPGFAEAAYNLGRLHFRRGERAAAQAAFARARELAAKEPELRARIDNAIKLLQ